MSKIFLVDDDQLSSTFLKRRLSQKGFEVLEFSEAKTFLEKLKDMKFEEAVVLLDINMPEISGQDVLSTIRQSFSATELPVIMLSGESDSSIIAQFLNADANDFIVKPANMDVALARINTQLSLARYHRLKSNQKQLEAINSLVVTYHHEINNPLTIALGSLKRDFSQIDEGRVQIALKALERIADIVRKIDRVAKSDDVKIESSNSEYKLINLKE